MSDTNTTATDEITVEIPEIGENIILPDFKPLPDISNISMNYVSAFNTGMNIYQCLNYLQGYTELTYEGLVQLIKDLKAYKKALEEYIDAMKKALEDKIASEEQARKDADEKEAEERKQGDEELKDTKVDRVGDTMTGTLNFTEPSTYNNINFNGKTTAYNNEFTHHMQNVSNNEKYYFDFPSTPYGASIACKKGSVENLLSVDSSGTDLQSYQYYYTNAGVNNSGFRVSTGYSGKTTFKADNSGIAMACSSQQRPLFNSKPIALLEDITSSGGGVSVTTLWSGSYPATLSTSSTVTVKGFSVARETADIFIFVLQTGDTLFEKYHNVVVYNDKHSTRSEFHGTILNGPYAPNSDSPNSYYKEEAIFSSVCQNLDEITYYAGIRKETQSVDASTGVLTTTVTGTEGANLVAVKCIELNNTASTTALAAEVVSEYDEAVSEFETKLNEQPDTEGPTVDIEPEEQPDEILSESDSTSVSESLSSSESQSESLSSSESQSESLSSSESQSESLSSSESQSESLSPSESQSESLSSSESQSESLSSSESQSESLVPPVDYGTQEPTV